MFSLVRNKNTKSFLQLKTNTKSQRWFGVWHCNLEIGRQLSQEYYTWNDFKTVQISGIEIAHNFTKQTHEADFKTALGVTTSAMHCLCLSANASRIKTRKNKVELSYSTEHLSKRRRDSLQNKVHFQVLKLYIARRIKAHNEVISRTQAPHTHIQPAQYGFWFIESREKKVDMVFLK